MDPNVNVDVEVRLLLTAHADGSIDWLVVDVESDGQTALGDAGTVRAKLGAWEQVTDLQTSVSRAVRSAVYKATVEAQFPARAGS